jgi:hypothetical protein
MTRYANGIGPPAHGPLPLRHMVTMEARSAASLLPEQRKCLEEFGHDIRDIVADPAVAGRATGALQAALGSGTPAAWTSIVNTVAELLDAPAADACAGARRRLATFVGENADLLRSAS